MAATRGARYLLRNGIDYINYQEYERALKYLREAETRQKELSNTEKLTLKRAIEQAQRGLREAVGSHTPYALSQRTRRPGGFSPAKPDKQIAAKPSDRSSPGSRSLRVYRIEKAMIRGSRFASRAARLPTHWSRPPRQARHLQQFLLSRARLPNHCRLPPISQICSRAEQTAPHDRLDRNDSRQTDKNR